MKNNNIYIIIIIIFFKRAVFIINKTLGLEPRPGSKIRIQLRSRKRFSMSIVFRNVLLRITFLNRFPKVMIFFF